MYLKIEKIFLCNFGDYENENNFYMYPKSIFFTIYQFLEQLLSTIYYNIDLTRLLSIRHRITTSNI
jgi:hypothetical protein